eukprot:CAMPEP_0202901172 /NCGR_PEP_ID=MMETSP1392-20130828/13764_1 /ASSEMBLY_ACC=CAM_ASM_000868 /TAXON_ID=225041 /ORGANISM="Chlamydomonas chlamydogama, Strain SAG 11-48b" /LENGTH=138 /DNA_ID=CAMNT_0049587689 /DNA_START=47 /DNA_END=463 /DNA_ORIENTATION=+
MAALASRCRPFASLTTGKAAGRQLAVRPYASKVDGAKQLVDETLKQHKVVVFSKSYCPYCAKAKSALGGLLRSDQFYAIEIENRADCGEIQDYLQSLTGARSVPRVFIDGKFIGGGDDTARLAQNGELKKLLASAGVL